MSIKHQIQNRFLYVFLSLSDELMPLIYVEVLKAGDYLTTVQFHSNTEEQEQEILVFITEFDDQNK